MDTNSCKLKLQSEIGDSSPHTPVLNTRSGKFHRKSPPHFHALLSNYFTASEHRAPHLAWDYTAPTAQRSEPKSATQLAGAHSWLEPTAGWSLASEALQCHKHHTAEVTSCMRITEVACVGVCTAWNVLVVSPWEQLCWLWQEQHTELRALA